jgi:DNA-binding transcriptional MerR regulator
MLRTYTETFIQPVLRQLIKLEQAYETDDVILSLAGKRANIMQRYGINEVTDNLLEKELTLTVNVGMGATDPQMKLQKFVAAMNTFVGMMEKKVPGINMQEVGKEIFGHLGYADGSRFFTTDNPQMLQLQQQLQQQQMELQKLQLALQNKNDKHLVDIHKATLASQTKLQDTQIKEAHEDQRNATTHLRALTEMQAHMQHERVMKHLDGVGKQMSMKEGSK